MLDAERPAPQHEFSQLNWHHVLGTHGFVLVYSIASAPSFDMVQIIYDKILNYSGLQKIPAVIVGSKADLDSRLVSILSSALSTLN
jgi:Ras family protein